MPRDGVAISNDLIRSFRTGEEEISGSVCLNTALSTDLEPLMAEGDKRITLQRNRRNSETLGRVGLETEKPVSLQHLLYIVQLL